MELNRRDFIKIVGAATVATQIPGCTPREPKSLIPYIIPHEEIIPGRSVWYASVCRECPAGCGVNIRVREGRATKAEGNPLHPVNHGALCARGQASLQGLYNPDRVQTPLLKNANGSFDQISWEQAEEILVKRLREAGQKGRGANVAWVSNHQTGSLDALIDDWLSVVGSKRRYRYEPFGNEALREANALTFGIEGVPTYDFRGVETIVSFGTDFLETWLSPVEFAHGFGEGRGYEEHSRNRLIYFGPRLSMTASNADTMVNVHPDQLGSVALALVNTIVSEGQAKNIPADDLSRVRTLVRAYTPEVVGAQAGIPVDVIRTTANALVQSRTSLAVAGGPTIEGEFGVQTIAAVNLLNYVCGNVGRSVKFGPMSTVSALSTFAAMNRLVRDLDKDEVDVLILSEVNPVYSLPTTSGFASAAAKVPFVVSCTSFLDETSALASLVLPLHTPFESWGDYSPRDGVYGLMQPAMIPVFATKELGDILLETGRSLSAKSRFEAKNFHEYVKNRWKTLHDRFGAGIAFESFWIESLARGGVWEETAPRSVRLSSSLDAESIGGPKEVPSHGGSAFTLAAYPSIAHYDGRGANRPWLQELPDPMTRLTWGSWIEISPADAASLGVVEGNTLQVTSSYHRAELPVRITRGLRPGILATPMGQGHSRFGRYADGVGVNAFSFLDPKPSPDHSGGIQWFGTRVEVLKVATKIPIASVQEADSQHDRHIIQEIPLAALAAGEEAHERSEPSLYPEQEYKIHHWGMVIDVDKCTGCSACVTACYAENNIPVVGKEEVANGREMAWLRIDRYYDDRSTSDARPERANFLPMLCQQCGDAPCETVCPVYAAYHTDEGLNGQVYNRCIGTRYCANNCPYKVRRFNWFAHDWPAPLNWQLNPDVTVRSKGVMEKCTFCVQRIMEGKNNARLEHRSVYDGEITSACQQACPSRAITFGDMKDPSSKVNALAAKGEPRPYHVLEELNTRPAVTYLKKIKNEGI